MIKIIQSALILFMLIGFSNVANAEEEMIEIDVFHLKNGSIAKGIIIEQVPDSFYKIVTLKGKIFRYKHKRIEKFEKEKIVKIEVEQTLKEKERMPEFAFLASLLCHGTGQCLVNGEPIKGILFFGGWVGGYVVFISNFMGEGNKGLVFLGVYTSLGCWIYSVVDATKTANRYNGNLRAARSIAQSTKAVVELSPSVIPLGFDKKELSYGLTFRIKF
jgi:hypothetical protein